MWLNAHLFQPHNYLFSGYAVPTAVTVALMACLGLAVLVRERGSPISVLFLAVTASMSVWLFAFSWMYCAADDYIALVWAKLAYVGVPCIPAAIYHFTVAVLGRYRQRKWWVWAGWGCAVCFAIAALVTPALIRSVTRHWWGYYPRYGWLGVPYLVFFFVVAVASFRHYWVAYHQAPAGTVQRRRTQALCLAFCLMYLGSFDYIAKYGIPLYPFGYVPVLAFLSVVAYAIWRYRLVDITPAFAAPQIVDTMVNALIVLDHEGIVRIVNRATCALLETTEAELIGKPFALPSRPPLMPELLGRLLCEGPLRDCELELTVEPHPPKTLSLSASMMWDHARKSVGTVCLFSDITERKQAEEALRRSEERYHTMVGAVVDYAIIGLDVNGVVETWNKGAEQIHGYTDEEVIGKPLALFYPDDDRANGLPYQLLKQASLDGRVEHTGWHVRKDGGRFLANSVITALHDTQGKIRGFSKVTRDITERRRAEEERDRIFNLSLDLLCIAGFDGYFKQLNPQWELVLGFSAEELLSKPYLEFVHPQDHASTRDAAERLIAGGTITTFENRYLCKDGSYKWLSWTAVPLPEQRLIYAAARDMTERIQAEQQLKRAHTDLKKSHEELKAAHLQLIQAAKMESVGRLAAGVAHEVKNPLAVILQGVDYLSKHVGNGNGNTKVVLRYTSDAVRRADSVIRGLLDFSTTRELVMAPEPVHDVIERALLLVKHERDRAHITLVRLFAESLPRVQIDRNKMEQVFVNLFMNAIHAMREGGTLTVRTSMKALTEISYDVGTRTRDRFRIGDIVVVVEVEDTGTGIPEEALSKVFDPFFTTKPTGTGTGLGLTVTKKIVDLHNGLITVKNREGGGVKAMLVLRAHQEQEGGKRHGQATHFAH